MLGPHARTYVRTAHDTVTMERMFDAGHAPLLLFPSMGPEACLWDVLGVTMVLSCWAALHCTLGGARLTLCG